MIIVYIFFHALQMLFQPVPINFSCTSIMAFLEWQDASETHSI